MSILLNTGFTVNAPKPIDSRMQVSTFAGLDAIVVKYDHMICHVIDEDVDYIYYENTPEWVIRDYGGVVNWGDIQGDILTQIDLINYLTLNFSDINHTHDGLGAHTHPPADITDISGIVTWIREHEALNYILTGSTNSTGVFQGTMNNFSVTDSVNTILIEDGDVLTFSPDFTVNTVNNVISYQETDPTVGAHIKAITTADISQWDAAYAHSISNHNYEYWLGTPAGEGYVLVSSILGVRTWVSPTSIGVVDHLLLTNIGVNTHVQIDAHIADTSIHQDTWKPNTSAQEGYVASGAGQVNKFWGTDVNGNPGWTSGNAVTGAAEIHDQAIAATIWTFTHNLLTLNPNIQVWSTSAANGEVLIPEKIIAISNTTAEIHFSTATTGRATAILGGIVSNDVSGLVPYTNASNNVDLGLFSITANTIIKSGGLSSQFLKADGSIDTNTYALAGVETFQSVTDVGNFTTNNIITQGITSSGTRVGANIVVVIGDYDGLGNGTNLEINSASDEITSSTTLLASELGLKYGVFTGRISSVAGLTVSRAWKIKDEDGTFAFLADITSSLLPYQLLSEKNVVNGYAGLDANGKINPLQLPALAISETFVVASEALMLATISQTGDVAVRTDVNKSFILQGSDPTILTNWQELLSPIAAVQSVFGRTGTVTAQANDYTWAQIDKTISSLADITTRTFSSLQSIPTTIAGYGITDYSSLWDSNLAGKTTDNLTEGITNLYYTDARVSANATVAANTVKTSFPGFSTLLSDYGFTDNSTNWNTAFGWGDHSVQGYLTAETDSQTLTWDAITNNLTISNGNFVTISGFAEDVHSHVVADVTGLQAALDGKVDDSQVLTDVPAGALFTDTVYTHPTGDGNLHVPANSTTNSGKVLTASGVAGTYTWETPTSGVTDHLLLSNIGVNTHAQIDTHIADGTTHFTQAAISITESQISDLGAYLTTITGEILGSLSDVTITTVSNGQVLTYNSTTLQWENTTPSTVVTDHTLLSNIGTNTHVQIDSHIADATLHYTVASIVLTASQISDFNTVVSANANVVANTAKISATGTELEPTDIDTLAELNALITDAVLIDTNDTRLSDARTPLAHTHIVSEITDLTAIASELNLLDLAGLSAGWILSADSATTASWKSPAGVGTGTILNLTEVSGSYYNMAVASTATTFTTSGTVVGAFAISLINAATEPVVTGATKIQGATFVASTDMHLVVQYFGATVQYYFLSL